MPLSSRDFRKMGLGVLGVIVVIVIAFFSTFTKGCTRPALAQNTQDAPKTQTERKASLPTLSIEQVVASPTEKESITIVNTGSETVDLTGWTLGDENDPNARGLAGALGAGERKVYDHKSLGFGINDADEIIYLKYKGRTIDRWEGK